MDAGLDATFSGDGKVTMEIKSLQNTYYVIGKAVAMQADGGIVVAGNNRIGDPRVVFVARFTSAGNPDFGFGTNGFATITDPDASSLDVVGVHLRSGGQIVVTNSATYGIVGFGESHGFVAMQLTAKGSVDTSFGDGGKVSVNNGAIAADSVMQPDGKLVIGGTNDYSRTGISASRQADFQFVRLDTNGRLDTSFDGDGKATVAFDRVKFGNDVMGGLALQPDGKIVAVGAAYVFGDFDLQTDADFAVARLNTNGVLDTTFNGTGKKTISFAATRSEEAASAVGIMPDGQILVAGADPINGDGFKVARLTSTGGLDAAFDGDGLNTISFGSAASPRALSIQPNGTAVITGVTALSSTLDPGAMVIARLTPAGALDTSLDGDGLLSIQFDGIARSGGYASTVQADGKVVVAGYSDGKFALARLAATGGTTTPPPPPPGPATQPQAITFGAAPATITFGQTFHVRPTSSSGLPVQLTATNAIVARAGDGGYDVIAQSGTDAIVLTATQPGDATLLPAPAVNASVATTRAAAVVTLTGLTVAYDGQAHPAGVVTSPAGLKVALAYTRNGVAVAAPADAGTYAVTATIADPNYQGSATGTLTIAGPGVGPLPPAAVVSAQSGRLVLNRKKMVTSIVLTFSGDLEAGSASNVANYRLAAAGTRGSFDARNARRIAIRGARYDASTHTVTVTVKPFAVAKPLQLRVYGSPGRGVLDAAGRLIDGNRDGVAGGDENALIRKKGITL